jgi:putative endonuclease
MNPVTAPPTHSSLNRALGDYGERLAARYLREQGLTILDRNWRCARGELDIVAMEGECLVVCEVKTRSSEAFGAPFEAVDWVKRGRLYQLARLWRGQAERENRGRDLRVDVISIVRPPDGPTRLQHLRCV